MTTVKFTAQQTIEIRSNGRTVELPILNFCEIDGDLMDVAARAQEQPGVEIPVPSKSFARGQRPRNSVAYGVSQ